jgi:hypothetical protein|tara:strand:- start:2190 stop:3563 length:1374 start_codon:yes stop_codon:yes gene_type:complete
MANKLNGFLDNVVSGALSPKGNLGDWSHAARLYVDDAHRLSPKHKFLYHVSFNLNPEAVAVIPQIKTEEINMLVKSVDLPKYSISTTLKHQYNKKANLQTRLDYDPINIVFHDDNYGQTTALWEAYYRYYYKDGNYASLNGSSDPNETNPAYARHNTYLGDAVNKYRYGFDNDSHSHFFRSIQIYQMSRHRYTCFTLVNPIISEWGHDTLENSTSDAVQNTMQIQYETVWYSRGGITEGASPKMFGAASGHYDKTPSPNSLAGGGATNLFGQGGVAAGAADVFGDITSGQAFSSPANFLGTVLKTTSVLGNAKSLSKGGLRQEGFGILKDQIGKAAGIDVSGVANTAFPKSLNASGLNNITTAIAGVAAGSAVIKAISGNSASSVTSFLDNNPGSLDQLAKATTFKKSHLANGGSANVDSINSAWNKMTSAAKDAFKSDTKDNAQTHGNSGNVTIST